MVVQQSYPAWIFEVQQWASRQIQCQTQWPYTICDWYKSRQSRFINTFVMITFDANDVRSCDYKTTLNVLWSISTKSWLNIQSQQKKNLNFLYFLLRSLTLSNFSCMFLNPNNFLPIWILIVLIYYIWETSGNKLKKAFCY